MQKVNGSGKSLEDPNTEGNVGYRGSTSRLSRLEIKTLHIGLEVMRHGCYTVCIVYS